MIRHVYKCTNIKRTTNRDNYFFVHVGVNRKRQRGLRLELIFNTCDPGAGVNH